jgi:RNA polymerase sigma-70 factor (ECF subfamily)
VEPTLPPEAHPGALHVLPGAGPLDWEDVYRRNVISIYRLMYSRVGNRCDAEDLTSQVFLSGLPHIRPGSSPGQAHSYLVATARTVLADHWRRRFGLPVTVIDDGIISASEPDPPAHARDSQSRLRRILDLLPANYRRVLTLRFLELRSVREAAAIMNVSAANVRVLQHRALRRASELGEPMDR